MPHDPEELIGRPTPESVERPEAKVHSRPTPLVVDREEDIMADGRSITYYWFNEAGGNG